MLSFNGDLFQKDLCQHALAPRTVAVSAPDPETGHSQPTPPLETLGHLQAGLAQSLVGSLLHSPGSWCTQGFVCALQQSCFTRPVICNQIPLPFKVKVPGGSQSLWWIPRLGYLLWALELSQQYKNFFGIIVHFEGCLLCGSVVCLPGLLQPEPLSPPQATANLCLYRRHSNTQKQV